MEQIIQHRTDTDFYKFTMYQVAHHFFPDVKVKAKLYCRTPGLKLGQHIEEIQKQLELASKLRFTSQELNYLSSIRLLRDDILTELEKDVLNLNSVSIEKTKNDDLCIEVEDYWEKEIWWELIILPIVQECYTSSLPFNRVTAVSNLIRTIGKFKEYSSKYKFTLSDFGARRRHSREWHDLVVGAYKNCLPGVFVGTSDVYFAMKYGVTPIGTFAHEMYQAISGTCSNLDEVIPRSLDCWVKEYRGDLGIALTDIYGLNVFLKSFDMYYSKLYDGVRHDSGDPILWGNMMLQHYKNNKVDPKNKSFVFSNGIDPMSEECESILSNFWDKAKVGLGIGTKITNDVGVTPANIVVKIVESNGRPTCKIPDGEGKHIGDEDYVQQVKDHFNYRPISQDDLTILKLGGK